MHCGGHHQQSSPILKVGMHGALQMGLHPMARDEGILLRQQDCNQDETPDVWRIGLQPLARDEGFLHHHGNQDRPHSTWEFGLQPHSRDEGFLHYQQYGNKDGTHGACQIGLQAMPREKGFWHHQQDGNQVGTHGACQIGLQAMPREEGEEEGFLHHQEDGDQDEARGDWQIGLQPMDGDEGFLHHQQPQCNSLHIGLSSHDHMESSIHIRQEATQRMRQYWAMTKRESRRRKRESDTSTLSAKADMNWVCTTMVKCWQEASKGMACEVKKATFQLLLEQPAFRRLHGGSERSILSNIQGSVAKVKASLSKEELQLKRALCMMLVNNEGDPSRFINNSQMARLMGLHRRNFAAANLRLQQAEAGDFPLHLCRRQQSQSRIITQEVKDVVFAFWKSETRVSPNKKDVCRKRLGRKAYIKHPVHLLDESQVCNETYYNYVDFLHVVIQVPFISKVICKSSLMAKH